MKFSFLILLLTTHFAVAQTTSADTAFLSAAKENAVLRYNDKLYLQSNLINGTKHIRIESSLYPRDNSGREHPYYSLEWIAGKVLYNGEWYSSTFWYDINKDQLIIPNIHETGQIQLFSEKIEQFTLGRHLFVRVEEKQMRNGFYEVIYGGKTKAYKRLQKIESTQYRDNKLIAEFKTKTTYYLKKNNSFYEIKSKRSILKALSDKRVELKNFLRAQSQPFSRNRDFFIREMAHIYDKSTTKE